MIIKLIAHIVTSFVGTVGFSALYNVDKKYYLSCGLTGTAGWLVYKILYGTYSMPMATFFGVIIVTLLSRILAVYKKCPITIFLASGIFPLYPGATVYYTAFYLVTDELVLALDKGILAVKVAFAIVLAIVFVVSIPKEWFMIKGRMKNKGGN